MIRKIVIIVIITIIVVDNDYLKDCFSMKGRPPVYFVTLV